jgi:hypothetical protein
MLSYQKSQRLLFCRREVHHRRNQICLPSAGAPAGNQLQALRRRLRKWSGDHQRDGGRDGSHDFAAGPSSRRHSSQLDGSRHVKQAVTGSIFFCLWCFQFRERALTATSFIKFCIRCQIRQILSRRLAR